MTLHAIKRAKERYKLELSFEDLKAILELVLEGEGKWQRYNNDKYAAMPYPENYTYKLRYKGKLIEPVIVDLYNDPRIVTFNPTGKNHSIEKYRKNLDKSRSKDYLQRAKRLRNK